MRLHHPDDPVNAPNVNVWVEQKRYSFTLKRRRVISVARDLLAETELITAAKIRHQYLPRYSQTFINDVLRDCVRYGWMERTSRRASARGGLQFYYCLSETGLESLVALGVVRMHTDVELEEFLTLLARTFPKDSRAKEAQARFSELLRSSM